MEDTHEGPRDHEVHFSDSARCRKVQSVAVPLSDERRVVADARGGGAILIVENRRTLAFQGVEK